MRAIVVNELGGPEVLTLEEHPDPEPGPGDLLVDVAAGGVNFIDIYQRTGIYPMDLPYVVGSEGAGSVAAVGSEVSDVAVGARVTWAMSNGTGYTDTAVVAAAKAVTVPDGLEPELAAAVMLQGMTAHFLTESTFPAQAGQTALVHAAAGGVGLLLSQMLRAKGV
jgi:NADPH2:quinone reductase